MGITTQLQQEYDYEIVDEFVDHYSVMCDVMEPVIIALEKEGQYTQNVQELFRVFHNIKSAASFLKIDTITRLAVLTEEILSVAREREGPATADFVNWLLMVRDQCYAWSQALLRDDDDLVPLNPDIMTTIPPSYQRMHE